MVDILSADKSLSTSFVHCNNMYTSLQLPPEHSCTVVVVQLVDLCALEVGAHTVVH